MFKITMLGVFFLTGFLVSGYFAFFHGRPQQVKTKLLEAPKRDLAIEFNSFIVAHPGEELNQLVDDLNWLLKNDYHRDLRVKRIIHQDLTSLVAISKLREKLEREDEKTSLAYTQALGTITQRTSNLRNTKDEKIRDEILLLGEMIERNDR